MYEVSLMDTPLTLLGLLNQGFTMYRNELKILLISLSLQTNSHIYFSRRIWNLMVISLLTVWFVASKVVYLLLYTYYWPGQHSWYSDSLQAGQSGDQIPVRARFSTPVQTIPEAHPASYTLGTGSFPGVKRPECGIDHPPPSIAEVKERVKLYL